MKPNTDLFELIKSLTKSEKRYFKMFASMQKGNKNYLKLFNEIENQTKTKMSYDEAVIKQKYKNEKFIKQLTFTKNYLYKLIFKCLISYNTDSSIESRLNELISRCTILYNKALYKQYFGTIEYAKNLAQRYERWNFYLQFIEMEKIIIIKKVHIGINEKIIIEEENDAINKIQNLAGYSKIVAQLSSKYRSRGRTRDKSFQIYISNIEKNPFLKSPDTALSTRAKEHYLFIHQILADFKGDIDGMLNYSMKRYELINNHPEAFEDLKFNYWQDIIMYQLLLLIRLNRADENEIRKYIDKLKEHSKSTDADRINVFLMENYVKLQMIIQKKQWEKLDDLITLIENGLKKYEGKTDQNFEVLLYNSIVRAFIIDERYTDAVKYLNILLNNPSLTIRKDIEWYAKILNLIVHYELENFSLLEYLIKSTYRYLLKGKRLYKLELSIINFIKKLPKIKNNNDLLENLELLRDEMYELKNDPFEKNAFLLFDFENWAEKKIESLKTIK